LGERYSTAFPDVITGNMTMGVVTLVVDIADGAYGAMNGVGRCKFEKVVSHCGLQLELW